MTPPGSRTPEPDPAVVRRARAGDRAAFDALAAFVEGPAWRLAWRMARHAADAEDLAQEVLAHLLGALPRYDPARPFMPWFYKVATRRCLNVLRGRRPERAALEAPEVPARGPPPGAALEEAERREAVRAAVAALPEDYRAVVALRYLEGLSTGETAAALGIPEGTVKVRLFRARARLREVLWGMPGG
ncbi:MAG: sigma-70 family RNA polymerase sigma factor [Planctomycetes bacterium]|nr:sigma-70 family RNA polymerase sigma factor [Planctomycetota bacterium]